MRRREFSKTVYAQIVHRAMTPDGQIACEGCGLILGKKKYHVDHIIADGLEVDKSRPLTADNGQLLGWDCCHKPKTKMDVGNIARAKLREAKHLEFQRTSRCFRKPPGTKYDWNKGRYVRID